MKQYTEKFYTGLKNHLINSNNALLKYKVFENIPKESVNWLYSKVMENEILGYYELFSFQLEDLPEPTYFG